MWASMLKYTVYVHVGRRDTEGRDMGVRTEAERKRAGRRNKTKRDWPDRRREMEKKSWRKQTLCFSDRERTGYKPMQSGRLQHMFPITSDWHQILNTSRTQAWTGSQTCNWFVPFPSPCPDFIFAFALLLTPPSPPFLFSPFPPCLSPL